jgi:pimeloyl-ACP methyl ester carboxylesterase
MTGAWVERLPWLGTAGRLDAARALRTRPGLSFLDTPSGRLRLRRLASDAGPRLLYACDGPNVIEHTDALLAELDGRADVVVFEPPGTGASLPSRDFDFTVDAFTRAARTVLEATGPRVLVFPCYLGVVGQALARQRPSLVRALVTPQASSWSDLARWADVVDRRRVVRTPVLGQALLGVRTKAIAASWYRASTSDRRFVEPFLRAACESFDVGGCFCLASLMQGYEASTAPPEGPVPCRAAVVVGGRDRTHRHSDFTRALPGADVVRFDDCGHSPELEAPARFASWLLAWCAS